MRTRNKRMNPGKPSGKIYIQDAKGGASVNAPQSNKEDEAAFNHRVGWATIRNLWVAIVMIPLGIAGILVSIFQVQIQGWVAKDHPGITTFFSGVKTWFATPWALPWIAWILIISATFGLGILTVLLAQSERARAPLLRLLEPIALAFNPYMGRNENVPPERPLSREEEEEIAVAALAIPLPIPPELWEMDIEQVAVLRQMGLRLRNVKAYQLAEYLNEPEVTILAALQQLQAWGLVTSDMLHWRLSDSGIVYVNKHKGILLTQAPIKKAPPAAR